MNNDEILSDEILKNVKVPTENKFLSPPPPFLMSIIQNIQQKMGVHFENVNVRVVGEDDLDTLPNEILNQILENAVTNESFELATKIRDIVNKRKENGK
jgi:protein-arginine kinase activator protein McsA